MRNWRDTLGLRLQTREWFGSTGRMEVTFVKGSGLAFFSHRTSN